SVEEDVLAGRADAPDSVVERVPEVSVGSGGKPQGAGAIVRDRERGDIAGGSHAPDAAIHRGEPERSVRPGNDAVGSSQETRRIAVERGSGLRRDAAPPVAGGGGPEVAVRAGNDIPWADNGTTPGGGRCEGWGICPRHRCRCRRAHCRIVNGRCNGGCWNRVRRQSEADDQREYSGQSDGGALARRGAVRQRVGYRPWLTHAGPLVQRRSEHAPSRRNPLRQLTHSREDRCHIELTPGWCFRCSVARGDKSVSGAGPAGASIHLACAVNERSAPTS